MGIGKTLSEILNEKNVNPNELAERLAITPSTIYSIIKRDNMKVDITVLARICKELDVPMERFYDEYVTKIKNSSKLLFNASENSMIKKYRFLDSYGQEAVDKILDIEYSRCLDNKEMSANNEQLIPSLVAARSKNNDEPIHIELLPDLSKLPKNDTDL